MISLYNSPQLTLFRNTPAAAKEVDETGLWQEMDEVLKQFPADNEELLPGLKWGFCYQLYTPAFWKLQYLMNSFSNERSAHRISCSLTEEIVLCLLGGYGIPSEMGIMAFERFKAQGLIRPHAPFEPIAEALSQPFKTGKNKLVKYRFANQKAVYICDFLNREDLHEMLESDDLCLRDWLMTLKGVGPKTASWITRNWLRSERVAILDIHLLRAGVITGFFDRNFNIVTEYHALENKYLNFCRFLQVRPSDMDAIIWSYMKKNNKLALNILSSIT